MNSLLIDKITARRKHLQNEESDDDDNNNNNEWSDDEPIKETKKQEIFKETKEAFLKKMESEIQQKK